MIWKMIFLFQGSILRFHVNHPGVYMELPHLTHPTPPVSLGGTSQAMAFAKRAAEAFGAGLEGSLLLDGKDHAVECWKAI